MVVSMSFKDKFGLGHDRSFEETAVDIDNPDNLKLFTGVDIAALNPIVDLLLARGFWNDRVKLFFLNHVHNLLQALTPLTISSVFADCDRIG